MEWRVGRAVVSTPGKYGAQDYRAAIYDIAPKLSEYALLLGGKLMAEDRYDGRRQQGRHLYLGYLKKVAQAHDMDEVVRIAEQTETARSSFGLPGFVRCCKGGRNDCVALCFDCFQAGFRLPDETVRSTLEWWGLATTPEEIEMFVRRVQDR
jgi:hypothetical protein